jgi:2-dehydro-3-deoxygalactonokinase
MTGELFAMFGREGSLAGIMGGEVDPASFDIGLGLALEGAPLSNALFSVRARVVSGSLDKEAARGVVSGLLVGSEFAVTSHAGGPVVLLGSAALTARYQQAAGYFGRAVHTIDPDAAYCAALAQFREAA